MKPLKGNEHTQRSEDLIRRSEDMIYKIHETMNDFRDPTKELIRLLREDSERQAKNDQMFLQLMQSMIVNNNQAGNSVFHHLSDPNL